MKKKSSAFVRMFLSYLVISLIPILLIASTQIYTSKRIITQTSKEYTTTLKHLTTLINTTVTDVQTLTEDIPFDQDVRSFVNAASLSGKSIYDLYLWKDTLKKYPRTNAEVEGVYVYSYNNNWLLTDKGSIHLNNTFYTNTLGFTGMSYEEWNAFASPDFINGFYRFPSGELGYCMNMLSDAYNRAFIVLHFKATSLKQILQPIITDSGCMAFLADANGELLQSLNEESFPTRNVTVSQWLSNFILMGSDIPNGYTAFTERTVNGWYCIALIPDTTLRYSVDQLTRQICYLTLAVLLLDIILSFMLSHNQAEPLRRIVSSLASQIPKEYLDNRNEYILIENSMAMLLKKNFDYRRLNDEQRELIDFELVRCLLMDETISAERLSQLAEHTQLPLAESRFGVITFQTGRSSNNANDMQIIRTALNSFCVRVLSLPDRYVALLFLPEDTDSDMWNDISHSIFVNVNTEKAIPFTVYISNLCSSAESISSAYNETVALIETTGIDANVHPAEMHFSMIADQQTDLSFYYPIDTELQIIQSLKMGNRLMVHDLLQDLRIHNFGEQKLSPYMIRQLIFELRGTVIRALSDYSDEPSIRQLIRQLYLESTVDGIISNIETISDAVFLVLHGEEDRVSNELRNSIYAYLLDHYADPNLSLSDLTEPLGVRERYLYDFIQEHFNSSFTKLLESIRITKACSLLRDSDISIKDAAIAVGYFNVQTFRLAFRRIMDITPSEYTAACKQRASND